MYILSGGINSEVIKGILDLENTQVRRVIEKLGKDFGDNFFIEVPAVERLEKARKMLFDIVRKNKFDNFVITNDVYYPNRKDAVLQKIVESIKEGSKIDTEKSENSEILYDDLYLKSENEIEKSFENKEYSEFYETGINNVEKIVENLQKYSLLTEGFYADVYSTADAVGHWKTMEGGNPFDGEIGKSSVANEKIMRFRVKRDFEELAYYLVKEAHPYETAVINVFRMEV